jgi:hypothetical protein
LQRTLETLVVAPLARHLLARPGLRGAEIRIDLDPHGRIEFSGAMPSPMGSAPCWPTPTSGWWTGRSN